MNLNDHLLHVRIRRSGNQRLVTIGRKKKREQAVLHREQSVCSCRRVKLEVRLFVVASVWGQLRRWSPLDDLPSSDDVLQIDILAVGLPL